MITLNGSANGSKVFIIRLNNRRTILSHTIATNNLLQLAIVITNEHNCTQNCCFWIVFCNGATNYIVLSASICNIMCQKCQNSKAQKYTMFHV